MAGSDLGSDLLHTRPIFIVMKLVPNFREPGKVGLAACDCPAFDDGEVARAEMKRLAHEFPGVVFMAFVSYAIGQIVEVKTPPKLGVVKGGKP